jgi:hypothetical protein
MGIKYDSMGFTKHCWYSIGTQWDIYHKSAIKKINESRRLFSWDTVFAEKILYKYGDI